MAYTIEAIVGDERVIAAGAGADTIIVPLAQGKAMVPISTRLRANRGLPVWSITDEAELPVLPHVAIEFISAFAKYGRVAYIEAEFFGGAGTQACFMWDDDGCMSAPVVEPRAINAALRYLGVHTAGGQDEFAALGLGRYRSADEWEQAVMQNGE